MKKELKGLYDLCKEKGLTDAELLPYFRTIESNLKTKRYGLVWEEQLEDIASDLKNKFPILVEREDLSIKAEPNGLTNCLIEGDNYESLTFLKNSGVKVDCIYIDPPYNTGNKDFVYNDKYIDSEDTWRHSSWLSFMNKRLKLAKDLLTEDGVIFISIDDNEQAQLKLLCDSIFGEQNKLGLISVVNNLKGRSDDRFFATSNEFLLVYAKNKTLATINGLTPDESYLNEFKFKDEISNYKKVMLRKTGKTSLRSDRPNLFYAIFYNEKTKKFDLTRNSLDDVEIWPKTTLGADGRWRWGTDTFLKNKDAELVAEKNKSNDFVIYVKMRDLVDGKERTVRPKTTWINPKYDTGNGTRAIQDLFGSDIFTNPKPIEFIKDILNISTNKNSIILDFFAGSGTTGQAVLELNKEDGGNRRFILLTNNEISMDHHIKYLKNGNHISGDSQKTLIKNYLMLKEMDKLADLIVGDAYQSLGICRSVTYKRLKYIIDGYITPKGKLVMGIPSNLKYFKVNTIETADNQLEIEDVLIENIVPFIQFKHNVWEKETVAEDLLELTNESESIYIYSNTLYLCDGFYESINRSDKPTTLYIYDGLFEFLDESRLANVNILSITNEFYKN